MPPYNHFNNKENNNKGSGFCPPWIQAGSMWGTDTYFYSMTNRKSVGKKAPMPSTPHPRTHKVPWRWHLSEVLGYLSSTVKSSNLRRQYDRLTDGFWGWCLGHMSASTGCMASKLGSDLSGFESNKDIKMWHFLSSWICGAGLSSAI